MTIGEQNDYNRRHEKGAIWWKYQSANGYEGMVLALTDDDARRQAIDLSHCADIVITRIGYRSEQVW